MRHAERINDLVTKNPVFVAVIPEDETDDYEKSSDYTGVIYIRKHLEMVVCTLDDAIALQSPNTGKNELKSRESEVSSIYSSGQKKRK
jgi:hypothetical protein